MKIAIHHTEVSFSDRWVSYCIQQNIPYKLVDCYKDNIIQQLSDCDALMWHFHNASPKDTLFAKQLLYSVAAYGKKIFPDYNTMWHFDDKVGQKYLLEAVGAPMVTSYVFYTKKEAMDWVNSTGFPKVFKLRSGASSSNVRLVKSRQEAVRLVNQAFGKGFSQYDPWPNFKERIRKFKHGKASLLNVFKGFIRLFYTTEFAKVAGNEKGYIYFQDFIPDNDCDIRVIVIGQKAFGIKRMVRENDFRASGGGNVLFDRVLIDEASVKIAFNVSEKLGGQCLAYDFVFMDGKPLIIEISYGFAYGAYDACPGYWDSGLNWHECKINPQHWMIDLIMK